METSLSNTKSPLPKKLVAVSLLIATTFFWGITFTIVKEAIQSVHVFVFLAQRFWFAFFVLLPLCFFRKHAFSFKLVLEGAILGFFLFGAYAFQTFGLQLTSASNAGFVTGMNVVFVPLMGGMLFKQSIPTNVRWAVLLATLGLFFLCTNGHWTLNTGDLLVLLCAIWIALHILLTGEYTPTNDVFWLTTIQLGVVALLSTLIAQACGDSVLAWHPTIFWTLVICVVFATVFAFLVQTSMQRLLTPSQTALIFCMEPVFAALYAYWAANERLGAFGIIGATLILFGMILSELPGKPAEG